MLPRTWVFFEHNFMKQMLYHLSLPATATFNHIRDTCYELFPNSKAVARELRLSVNQINLVSRCLSFSSSLSLGFQWVNLELLLGLGSVVKCKCEILLKIRKGK